MLYCESPATIVRSIMNYNALFIMTCFGLCYCSLDVHLKRTIYLSLSTAQRYRAKVVMRMFEHSHHRHPSRPRFANEILNLSASNTLYNPFKNGCPRIINPFSPYLSNGKNAETHFNCLYTLSYTSIR